MDDEPRIIGKVYWDGPTVAELHADGSWRVTVDGERSEVSEWVYASLYEDWDHHPSLYYGQGILPDLAEKMGGRFIFCEPLPEDPDVVN